MLAYTAADMISATVKHNPEHLQHMLLPTGDTKRDTLTNHTRRAELLFLTLHVQYKNLLAHKCIESLHPTICRYTNLKARNQPHCPR